jgi:hypothetical protein
MDIEQKAFEMEDMRQRLEDECVSVNLAQQYILKSNKGVVVCAEYNGDRSCDVSYQNGKGEPKTLTLHWGTEAETATKGSLFYIHIDDETNEVLVVSKEPFPY